MNKHFIFSQDLFKAIQHKFSTHAKMEENGVIVCGENFICSYNILEKKQIKTPFIQLNFKDGGAGEIIKIQNEEIMLYFLLHTSDEKHFGNQSQSYFQIPQSRLKNFWIKEYRFNKAHNYTQVVLFMHERCCTAFSSFNRILEKNKNNSLEQFLQEIQSLFDFHDTKQRDHKRKEFLQGLGYGAELKVTGQMEKNNSITYMDIKNYYV